MGNYASYTELPINEENTPITIEDIPIVHRRSKLPDTLRILMTIEGNETSEKFEYQIPTTFPNYKKLQHIITLLHSMDISIESIKPHSNILQSITII